MALRETTQEQMDNGFIPVIKNPTLSKRLVIENLNSILDLLEQGNDGESPYLAAERISRLIEDIDNDKLKPGSL